MIALKSLILPGLYVGTALDNQFWMKSFEKENLGIYDFG